MATYSSYQLCDAAGITYRILDYWVRTGALEPTIPARGSGTQRRFTRDDIRIARVLARLGALGATTPILAAVHDALRRNPPHDWPPCIFVDRAGNLVPDPDLLEGGGWIIPTNKTTTCAPCMAA